MLRQFTGNLWKSFHCIQIRLISRYIKLKPEMMEMSAPPQAYHKGVQPTRWQISYVDFTPALLEPWGFLSSPKYERFDALMNKANEWLRSNPNVNVKTCESIEVKEKQNAQGMVDTDKSSYWESGEHSSYFVRCLRIWIVPKGPSDSPHPQQIGYLNVIPACIESGGFFSNPKFDTYGDTIGKVNQMFRQQPLPGKIITVESQDMKFKEYKGGVDPDESFWREYGERSTYFLVIIRIFYVVGTPAYEEIGCADFVPARLRQDGFMSSGQFEPLHQVVGKAQLWLQQNPSLNLVNVQTIDYKLKSTYDGQLDTQRSLFREAGEFRTYYVRIVRVCYTKYFNGQQNTAPPPVLTYRSFVPAQITAGGVFSVPKFETMSQTAKRAMAWFQHTGARVVSAETVSVRMYTGHQHMNPEETYTYNPGERSEHHVMVFRVFLDGHYQDPPIEALPPAPVVEQNDDCCCIII